ncbi:hypothetical protein EXW96_13170 [Paenibacillus sp. JMULE4]|uniref:hypothetical protein n=1 Tax=Paenibacillus sp. JMULE4 TaxID=2518342 RepID=UPI0015765E60|nr:hypothetical protein [Paenibacillus sp. JMULE4]NTZ18489.1 hypothetical protein [Paenibacillus sp. JMULE4]
MEATFTLTPKGAVSPIVLPILLKDNKMYLHLPAISPTDEYIMLPLENAQSLWNADRGLASGIFAEQWSPAAPSSVSTVIDEQGFIREQSGKLSFTDKKSGKAVSVIEWTQQIDDVNQTPNFSKEEPKQVKNLQDILRLLPAAPKS